MTWTLWLDDIREPFCDVQGKRQAGIHLRNTGFSGDLNNIHWAKTTEEAKELVKALGAPAFMYLDHDLGWDDNAMVFLKWLSSQGFLPMKDFSNQNTKYIFVKDALDYDPCPVPDYKVISANPVGRDNIRSFMDSWKKSV